MKPAIARPLVCAVTLSVITASLPAVSFAQTDAQKRQATEHYEKGVRFYDIGKYQEAIDEYQKAYLIIEDPILLYNIAQAYRLWDKPEEAVRFYRNYLRRAPSAQNRADVEKKLAELEKLAEDRRRSSTTPVTPQETVTTPPPPVQTVPPPPPPVQPAPTVPPPATADVQATAPPVAMPAPAKSRALPYALLGAGAVLLTAAIIAGAVAGDKAKKVEEAAMKRAAFDPALEQSGQRASSIAVVTGLLGMASAVTGAIVLLSSRSGGEATAPAASARPRLALFPVVAPGLAGGAAKVTF